MSMNLGELLTETDALTYINALKVTLTQIKDEISTQDELRDYLNQSGERTKKLIRRADGQYRLITKLVTKESPTATKLVIDEDAADYEELKSLMEET